MTRHLVVTADDLGLTDGTTRAVQQAHLHGLVSATSLLAVGRAFDSAARMLEQTPTLDLGAHLAIVGEDPPLLSAAEVPTLVDRRGRFPLSYRTVVRRGLVGALDPDDVRRELAAQLDRVRGIGLPVTHLDTHQHTHLWPSVARVVLELATEHRVPWVRLPRSARPGPTGLAVEVLSRRLARRAAVAGVRTTEAYAGLDEAGRLDGEAWVGVLGRLGRAQARTAEVNCHPGEAGDADLERFTWSYRWAAETAALTDPRTAAAVEAAGYHVVGFRDLAVAPGVA
jgi:predicted glycoside hydrolase/deacetylase ChbG (UPF0249 family)